MLKERIQEIFEFTKSESPYRKANKGWINQDIFLDLSPSPDIFEQKNEAAKVTLFWSPINKLVSNIFIIIIISSILVFTSLSFAKGRFNFNLFNNSSINDIVKVEDKMVLKSIQPNTSVSKISEKNLEINELDKTKNKTSLDDNQIITDSKTIIPESDKKDVLIKNKKK